MSSYSQWIWKAIQDTGHQQVKWKISKRHGHNPNYCSNPTVFSARNSSNRGSSHRISKQLPDPLHFRKAETVFCGLTFSAKNFNLRGWSKSVDCASCRIQKSAKNHSTSPSKCQAHFPVGQAIWCHSCLKRKGCASPIFCLEEEKSGSMWGELAHLI